MKLVITTQYKENYGDEKNPHWKFKGGSTYICKHYIGAIRNQPNKKDESYFKKIIQYKNTASAEYILDFVLVPDGWRSEYEISQEEYIKEGRENLMYYDYEISLNNVLVKKFRKDDTMYKYKYNIGLEQELKLLSYYINDEEQSLETA
jgi:hypothetical protein